MSGWNPGIDHGEEPQALSLVFAFARDRMLVLETAERTAVPRRQDLPPDVLEGSRPIFIGRLDGAACFAVSLDFEPELEGIGLRGLRELFLRLSELEVAVAGRASQTVEWYLAHAFCGRCGAPTRLSEAELSRICPECGALHFPRITPAVIMLVERADRVLLARNANFRGPFWSCLAGFVEPGETLEQAVAREVMEEVGLEVKDVHYFGSQAWPFPSQIMIGFQATCREGDFALQASEILEAGWFGPGELPQLPGPFSIARRLIDAWLARQPQGSSLASLASPST